MNPYDISPVNAKMILLCPEFMNRAYIGILLRKKGITLKQLANCSIDEGTSEEAKKAVFEYLAANSIQTCEFPRFTGILFLEDPDTEALVPEKSYGDKDLVGIPLDNKANKESVAAILEFMKETDDLIHEMIDGSTMFKALQKTKQKLQFRYNDTEFTVTLKGFCIRPEGNTLIEYLYRDASNYKVHNKAIVRGSILDHEILDIMDSLYEHEYFIPGEIGLTEEKFEDTTEDDHPWFELQSVERTDMKTTESSDVLTFHDDMVAMSRKWESVAQSRTSY